jgi:hypothetical protein
MPPHIKTVLRYQSGKLPLFQASAKLLSPKGPEGVSDAMSGGTPGRSEATAIQAKGTAQNNAAALAASSAQSRPLPLISLAFSSWPALIRPSVYTPREIPGSSPGMTLSIYRKRQLS